MSVSDGPNLGVMINALTGDVDDVAFRAFLRAVDAVLQLAVISKTLAAPPGSPANGDRYIVAASPTGAWAGHANNVTVWTTDNPITPSGLWEFYPPKFGWIAPCLTDGLVYVYNGSAWIALGGGGSSTLAADTDVLISSPADGDVLTYVASASKWENRAASGGAQPYLIVGFVPGTLTTSQDLIAFPVDRTVNFAANFSGSQATLQTAATATTVFIIYKIVAGTPTQIGTITFPASGTGGTFASTSGAAQSLAAGNVLQVLAPVSADATAAGLGFTLSGTR
jgi:hypothetical protein